MTYLSDSQAECLHGGWWSLTVAPTIVVNTGVQASAGNSIAVGILGGTAESSLAQFNALGLFTIAA